MLRPRCVVAFDVHPFPTHHCRYVSYREAVPGVPYVQNRGWEYAPHPCPLRYTLVPRFGRYIYRRWPRLPGTHMPLPRTRIKLVDGCVVEPPVYCDHPRGRNWAATVAADKGVQGGVRRDFWQRGPGYLRYVVPLLSEHAVVEFGADYVSTTPRRHPTRWYGVLVRREELLLVLEDAQDFLAAWRRAAQRRAA